MSAYNEAENFYEAADPNDDFESLGYRIQIDLWHRSEILSHRIAEAQECSHLRRFDRSKFESLIRLDLRDQREYNEIY